MNHKIEVAKIEVAIVEPIKPLAICLQSYLAGSHFDCRSYFDASAFLETLTSSTANICIISGRLIHHNNASILTSIKNQQPGMILIAITDSQINEERLNEERLNIVAAGLTNILEHPISKETLLSTLEKLTHHITPTLAADNALIDSSLLEEQRPSVKSVKTQYYGFIGQSERMQQVYNTINAAAESKATVFITGESGTGKEVCAAAIHERSKRRHNLFVPINCAAIPKDLMESEIFGHTKGAFTGAHARREGAASRADQGTLFLDEIGEMDLDLQSKLLRFIQTGTFQKVGSSTIESVDIRFICATNKDPLEQIKNGSFREDLYYRLHVIPIYLPPLRARGHDVLLIAQAFLDRYSNEEARDFTQFSPETKKTFLDYDWPGNIRQLQNVIRNVVVLNNGLAVNKEMLPPPLNQLSTSIATDMDKGPIDIHQGRHKNNPSSATENPHPTPQDRQPEPLNQNQTGSHPSHRDEILSTANIKPLWQIEKAYIESAIHACDKNIPKAAKHLGVSPSTLYRKLHQWKDQSLASTSTSTSTSTANRT